MKNEFKLKNKEILRNFFELYTKHSGSVPLAKLREYISEVKLSERDKNLLIDVLINDAMINFTKSEIMEVDDEEEFDEIENEIIDDIDVTEHLKITSEANTYWRKKITIEDEQELFDFYAEIAKKNELEYISIPELINIFLASEEYAKTYEVKRFIKLFVEVLEDNF